MDTVADLSNDDDLDVDDSMEVDEMPAQRADDQMLADSGSDTVINGEMEDNDSDRGTSTKRNRLECAAIRRTAKKQVKAKKALKHAADLAERKQARDSKSKARAKEKEQKKKKGEMAVAKQLAVVAALTNRQVARGDTIEYRDYVREVVDTCVRKEASQTQLCTLVGMRVSTFGVHVSRCCGTKPSNYQGMQPGRPVHLAEDAQMAYLQDQTRRKSTRTCQKPAIERAQVLLLAQASLKARDRQALPSSFCYEEMSKTLKKFRQGTGTGVRKGGRDNSARARALESPRILIFNYAGILSLCDFRFTHDGLHVHLSLRGNVDSVMCTTETKDSLMITVCRKCPLGAADQAYAASWDAASKQPSTTQVCGRPSGADRSCARKRQARSG